MNRPENKKNIGSVMVIGGGISGIQASLDLAESGFKVYLVDSAPSIGGNMARLDKTFPTNECAMCVISPKLVDCGRHMNIELVTYSEVEDIQGAPGNFNVSVLKKPGYVDFSKCNGCGECANSCPVFVDSEFDYGIGKRNAVYRLYPQAIPNVFVIDRKASPPCRIACPAGINVQGYVALAGSGKYKEAYELINKQVAFASVLSRVCNHPCEAKCNRNEVDEPVSVNAIKRFVCDWHENNRKAFVPEEKEIIPKKEKVAVIGAGPSGLTCAYDLLKLGYQATVFNDEQALGGMLMSGIPRYRLPVDILERDIKEIEKSGITVKKAVVGRDITLKGIMEQGYQAVYIAVGMPKSRPMNIEGYNLEGVSGGIDFLRDAAFKPGVKLEGRVVVIGGGNVAVDVALTARRLGVSEVNLVCLEKLKEMPAHSWEVEQALEEGVKIYDSYGPKRFIGEKNKVNSVELIKCGSVFDKDGRFNPSFIEGAETSIKADIVFVAIGQESDLSLLKDAPEIKTSKNGTIIVDPVTLQSGLKGVFCGGDVVTGPSSVVRAIGQGKQAAVSIDRYLQGNDIRQAPLAEESKPAPLPEIKIAKSLRKKMPLLQVRERLNNFKEVELGFSEDAIKSEALRCVNCAVCSLCGECQKACKPDAIRYDMAAETKVYNVGAVIFASGFDLFDARKKREYGFGIYKNVVTSIQFERLLSASGPTKGEVLRPSDNACPKRIAFIQCVGSRDISGGDCGNEYCSSVCCMHSTKEAIIAREHDAAIKPVIFFIDIRAFGKDYDRYYESAQNDHGVRYVRCMVSKVNEDPVTGNLEVKYVDAAGNVIEEEFDLVVLATGLVASNAASGLAKKIGLGLDKYNFIDSDKFYYNVTNKPGIFASGTIKEPQDIPDSVASGSASANFASLLLSSARGTLTKKKKYPEERDISNEDLRIGVFVCHCGRNISSVVSVKDVVKYAQDIKDVAFAEDILYTCSQDGLAEIKKKILEFNLNRVVVASCTPRTHDMLFRDTVRETGLNPYLFEMASIREQCSWVHREIPSLATEKAKELVNIMVEKVRLSRPVRTKLFDINHKCLVIGGGPSGLISSLSLARQGYEVYLIEAEGSLGGQMRNLFFTLSGWDPQSKLSGLIEEVKNNNLIHVYCNAGIKELKGHIGDFHTTIEAPGLTEELEHGAVIVATGAAENKVDEYLYGKDERVITQKELEKNIFYSPAGFKDIKSIAMIQCVGSRDSEHPYCSRVCCGHAIKNAIKLKEINPAMNIYIIYRDIRTYGLMERYYLDAREKGVIFIRYEKEKKPKAVIENGKLKITHLDPFLGREITIFPDLLALSVGMAPNNSKELSQKLKVPLNSDGFFLEAHPKIRPLDFTSEGLYLCGTAHSPRYLEEAVVQANAAAIRAVTLLSKDKIRTRAEIARVNEKKCTGCGICVAICPYGAREIDPETNVAKVLDVLCQGCGGCAVSCPSGASEHECFQKKQILSMIDSGA